jgi:hypothetical protein
MSIENENLVRCNKCLGKKKITGLGMIEKQCPDCIGIGWLAEKKIDIMKKPEIIYKKRGRKKKEVDNELRV